LKRYEASCGPAADSGWYCTEKAGIEINSRPSTTESFNEI
jgi:hypothetical protein